MKAWLAGFGIGLILLNVLSCLITCGVIKVITMCFGWTFTWGMATGVWLLMSLARSVFKSNTTVKK
jgi:hypothetical protein